MPSCTKGNSHLYFSSVINYINDINYVVIRLVCLSIEKYSYDCSGFRPCFLIILCCFLSAVWCLIMVKFLIKLN